MTRESTPLDDGECDAARNVRLDEAGDDVRGRTLRRDDEVEADRSGELGDPADQILDLPRRDHHQVGELVDDDDDVGQRRDAERRAPSR